MANNTLFNLHPNELRYSTICLVVCIICWNFQMELIRNLEINLKYDKPFLIVWLNTSLLIFSIPLYSRHNKTVVKEPLKLESPNEKERYYQYATQLLKKSKILSKYQTSLKPVYSKIIDITFIINKNVKILLYSLLGTKRALPSFSFILIMALLQVIPYFLWYFAINYSNVSDMMVISNSSSIFTYILTIIILKEQISLTKLLGIALSFTGVIYMSLWNSEEDIVEEIIQDEVVMNNNFNETLIGDLKLAASFKNATLNNSTIFQRDIDLNGLNEEFREDIDILYKKRIIANILAVAGSFFFGLSDVVFTKYVQVYKPRAHVSRGGTSNTQIIFDRFSIRERKLQILMMVSGLIGIVSLLIFWPGIPLLSIIGFEPFEIPSISIGLELIFIATLGFIYNYCYNYGSTLSGTVQFTCGLMMSLPITILSDYFINKNPIRQSDIISSLLIIVGEFIMIGSNRGDILSSLKLIISYLKMGLRKIYDIIIYPLPCKDQLDIDNNGIFCCCKIYVQRYYFKNRINSLTRSRSNHLIDVSKMSIGDLIPKSARVKPFKLNSSVYEALNMEELHHHYDDDSDNQGSSSNSNIYQSSSNISINIA
ncbi:hypothetical protein BCR32DRAFT_292646 [Anaeromyces robustus]|uniref:EamA domain-containing protein n=1 Tax=Anaeromyces robustus TaxID=1754192 RepID=A0A1Y1X9J3_9FUNG|nr:hypothetical protein BCR32DRAFT_292646 [Anaeromyces robustus]|eukprot:ORX82415.1 hypothetical protein BCR32DRAFT_292646 [Anaeromyces robustus]